MIRQSQHPDPIAIAAVWLSLVVAAPAADYNLAPRYERGTEVHYISRSTIDHRVQADAAGINERVNVRTEAGMSFAVTEVNTNGNAELRWTLHYLALTANTAVPGIPEMLDYDSRKPDASQSPLASLFARLLERPVTLRVDPAGRVLEFRGFDSGPSSGGLKGMTNPLDSLAATFFTREAFEQLPLFITAQAPTPARPGAKWDRTMTIAMPLGVGSLVMEQQFEFKRANRRSKTANIEMTGTVSKTNAPGAMGSMLGGALNVDQGTMSGQFAWDLMAGQVSSAETQMKMQTSLNSPLGRLQLTQDMTSSIVRLSAKHIGRKHRKQTPPPPREPKTHRPKRGT